MPLPALVYGAGLGALHLGRAALPAIGRGIGSIFGKKLTVGSAAAMGTAHITLPWLDQQTGHVTSEALLKTPLSGVLEAGLRVNGWKNDTQASVFSNGIVNQLEEKGKIDPANEQQMADAHKIADGMGHLIVGDTVGAASIASDLGISEADLVSAVRDAKNNNPDAPVHDLGLFVYDDLQEKIRQNRLEQQSTQTAEQQAQPAFNQNAAGQQSPAEQALANGRDGAEHVVERTASQISSAFEKAADNAGFMGMLMKGVSFIAGLFGEQAKVGFQKYALSMMDVDEKYEKVADGVKSGSVITRFDNPFGVGKEKPQPGLNQTGPTLTAG